MDVTNKGFPFPIKTNNSLLILITRQFCRVSEMVLGLSFIMWLPMVLGRLLILLSPQRMGCVVKEKNPFPLRTAFDGTV